MESKALTKVTETKRQVSSKRVRRGPERHEDSWGDTVMLPPHRVLPPLENPTATVRTPSVPWGPRPAPLGPSATPDGRHRFGHCGSLCRNDNHNYFRGKWNSHKSAALTTRREVPDCRGKTRRALSKAPAAAPCVHTGTLAGDSARHWQAPKRLM